MRWLTLIALVMIAGCSQLQQNADQLQQDADDEAARVADYVLPEALNDEMSNVDPQTPEQRKLAAEDWLSKPGGPRLTGSRVGASWNVRGSKGTTIRVDVYQYLESGSFLPPDQGEARWGVACRTYNLAEKVVTSTVKCPEGTPENP